MAGVDLVQGELPGSRRWPRRSAPSGRRRRARCGRSCAGRAGTNEQTVAAAARPRDGSGEQSRAAPRGSPGTSPERTSTSPSKPSSAPRAAARTASPVPRGGSLHGGDRHPPKASAALGRADDDDRVGAGVPRRERSPSRPCAARAAGGSAWAAASACAFPARPRARRRRVDVSAHATRRPMMAGAPGFEPGIAGPKPAALPLGYAPLGAEYRRLPAPVRRGSGARALGEQDHERDHGDDGDGTDRDPLDDEERDRDQHRERLRGGEDPARVARGGRACNCARPSPRNRSRRPRARRSRGAGSRARTRAAPRSRPPRTSSGSGGRAGTSPAGRSAADVEHVRVRAHRYYNATTPGRRARPRRCGLEHGRCAASPSSPSAKSP